MDMLLKNTVEERVMGHEVSVPTPEAYVLHKMVINGERRGKAEKDRAAIIRIWPMTDRSETLKVLLTCTRKECLRVARFMEENDLQAEGQQLATPSAGEVVASVAGKAGNARGAGKSERRHQSL